VRELYEEGLRIPFLRFCRDGSLNQDVVDMISANVRVPDLVRGDLSAQLAANGSCARRLIEILDELQLHDPAPVFGRIIGGTRRAVLQAIAAVPPGEYRYEVMNDGVDGESIRIAARVVVAADGILVDYTGSSLQVSDVAAAGAADTRGWWGKFTLAPARLRGGLDARVALECRDARPLLAALGVGLPAWTRGLLTLESLTADAEILLAPERTRVHALEARGGEFHILGEYARRSGEERGVFLLESRLLRVGVHAHDGQASLHLLGVRSWFQQQSAAIAQTSREDSRAGGK